MNFNLGEFFCGPGGIALGALRTKKIKDKKGKQFSITPFWATDYDLDTCHTYAQNIHKKEFHKVENVIHADIRKVDISKLPKSDAFAFGFPCNDFSLVGESKGLKGTFGPLYSYGVEYLKIHQPKWFVAENVGGLSSSNEGDAFKIILKSLRGVGYTLYPHLYKFEEYGVPQSRHRIIITGIRNDLGVDFKIPAPFTKENMISCKYALTNPPIAKDAQNNEATKQSSTVIERLKFIKPGENAWSENIPEALRLNVKGAKLSNIYKRLDPNKPAYTVTGSGGGGTHMYHWKDPRALTNRERARLQTFPDNFFFHGSKESVRKQIGMAVPPDGMKVIFEAILKSFANINYRSIDKSIDI
jgi:DNA (cytosine-5)-methyltransferase 1